MQIVFRNMDSSEAIKIDIKNKVEKLNLITDHITSCRVTVEAPHKHHHKGNLYNIKIDVNLPGEVIHATHHTGKHQTHEDVYIAIRDAFDATIRQIKNYVRRRDSSTQNKIVTRQQNEQAWIIS